jgi:hypothetical protein
MPGAPFPYFSGSHRVLLMPERTYSVRIRCTRPRVFKWPARWGWLWWPLSASGHLHRQSCAAGQIAAKHTLRSTALRVHCGAKEQSAPAFGRQRQEKGAAIRCQSGGLGEEVQGERRTERDSVREATPASKTDLPGMGGDRATRRSLWAVSARQYCPLRS